MINTPIEKMVTHNYLYSMVLHYFGIKYYENQKLTLGEVCKKKGINPKQVVQKLESVSIREQKKLVEASSLDIDVIVSYLKNMHRQFVNEKLPYIEMVVMNLHQEDLTISTLSEDLKIIFPEFVQDFVHHIYEEEDSLFRYLLLLDKFNKTGKHRSRVINMMENKSINEYAVEHHCEDEMSGLREITNNYHTNEHSSIHEKIVMNALLQFEQELDKHAEIEDRILFYKGLQMEQKARLKIKKSISFN